MYFKDKGFIKSYLIKFIKSEILYLYGFKWVCTTGKEKGEI